MTNRKMPGSNFTAAQRRAQEAFKDTMAQKPPSDQEIAKKAFDENRERLKTLRLANQATTIEQHATNSETPNAKRAPTK